MKYLLTEEEFNNLVPKTELIKKENQVRFLARTFKESCACIKERNGGYCDDCLIGSLKNGLDTYTELCVYQEYSK